MLKSKTRKKETTKKKETKKKVSKTEMLPVVEQFSEKILEKQESIKETWKNYTEAILEKQESIKETWKTDEEAMDGSRRVLGVGGCWEDPLVTITFVDYAAALNQAGGVRNQRRVPPTLDAMVQSIENTGNQVNGADLQGQGSMTFRCNDEDAVRDLEYAFHSNPQASWVLADQNNNQHQLFQFNIFRAKKKGDIRCSMDRNCTFKTR